MIQIDDIVEAILREADCAFPLECCGILLGRDGRIGSVLPARNVAADPARRFEIDPQALVDAWRRARSGGPELVGYYHSHPGGPAEPSAVDDAAASRDGMIWAIAGKGAVRFWRDDESGFRELSRSEVAG